MTIVTVSPIFAAGVQFNNSGLPLAGGKIFAYEGGSYSVLKDTYADSSGTVANTNPIILDSSGRLSTSIWLESDQTYNLVLTQADGTTILEEHDYVNGAPSYTQVIDLINGAGGAFLPLTGGAITGGLSVSGTSALAQITASGTLTVAGASTLAAVSATSVTAALDGASSRVTNVAAPVAGTDATNKTYVDAVANVGVPSGCVMYLAGSTIPSGWLLCDGAVLLRDDYVNLFAAIGTTYGAPSSTTFKIPDVRGYFIRGLDAGRSVDSGRTLGSDQADEFKSHTHTINADNGGFNVGSTNVSGTDRSTTYYTPPTNATGGSETRPVNIAFNGIIKT